MLYRWLMDVFPDLLIGLIPVVVISAGFACWRRVDGPARRRMCWTALGVAVFAVLDFALLAALPRLGLSYGPPEVALAALWALRLVLLLVWARLPMGPRAGQCALFASQILLTGALLYSFYYEPFDVRTTFIELPAPELESGKRLRIVQLSDIHVERISPRERRVLAAVREARPDLIVLTGDYLNNSFSSDPQARQDLRWMLGELRAPYGIYAIKGSTETAADLKDLLGGLNVQYLDDEIRVVNTPAGDLTLVGINDRDHTTDVQALNRAARPVARGKYSILLYHNPDLIKTAAQSGIDLYLAGHTHGGQICAPFYGALITLSIYGKQFEQGLYEYEGTRMYVSRGLGMEGRQAPRARFLAPPEVVVLDLMGQ